MDAHLMLKTDAAHIIVYSGLALRVRNELRYEEKRDAFHASRRIGQARQNQMDDILGHLMLAPSDINLLAENLIGAIILGHGATGQSANV